MIVKVRVIPKAKKERVEPLDEGLKVYLTEPSREGRANKRLIEVLADYYNTKKYNISIVSGCHRRDKLVKVSDNN